MPYSPPSRTSVDFELRENYTVPSFDSVDFTLKTAESASMTVTASSSSIETTNGAGLASLTATSIGRILEDTGIATDAGLTTAGALSSGVESGLADEAPILTGNGLATTVSTGIASESPITLFPVTVDINPREFTPVNPLESGSASAISTPALANDETGLAFESGLQTAVGSTDAIEESILRSSPSLTATASFTPGDTGLAFENGTLTANAESDVPRLVSRKTEAGSVTVTAQPNAVDEGVASEDSTVTATGLVSTFEDIESPEAFSVSAQTQLVLNEVGSATEDTATEVDATPSIEPEAVASEIAVVTAQTTATLVPPTAKGTLTPQITASSTPVILDDTRTAETQVRAVSTTSFSLTTSLPASDERTLTSANVDPSVVETATTTEALTLARVITLDLEEAVPITETIAVASTGTSGAIDEAVASPAPSVLGVSSVNLGDETGRSDEAPLTDASATPAATESGSGTEAPSLTAIGQTLLDASIDVSLSASVSLSSSPSLTDEAIATESGLTESSATWAVTDEAIATQLVKIASSATSSATEVGVAGEAPSSLIIATANVAPTAIGRELGGASLAGASALDTELSQSGERLSVQALTTLDTQSLALAVEQAETVGEQAATVGEVGSGTEESSVALTTGVDAVDIGLAFEDGLVGATSTVDQLNSTPSSNETLGVEAESSVTTQETSIAIEDGTIQVTTAFSIFGKRPFGVRAEIDAEFREVYSRRSRWCYVYDIDDAEFRYVYDVESDI